MRIYSVVGDDVLRREVSSDVSRDWMPGEGEVKNKDFELNLRTERLIQWRAVLTLNGVFTKLFSNKGTMKTTQFQ
jgi:hypothetical protein